MERYNVIVTSIFPQPGGFGTARTVINPQPLDIEAASDLATERRNQGAVVTLEAVRTITGGTMKAKPLDDLELFELLRAAYPEKFKDDDDETWDAAQQFADEIAGWQDVADLLGRVVMLTMPMESGLTKRLSHCLGSVTFNEGSAQMIAAVRRDVA